MDKNQRKFMGDVSALHVDWTDSQREEAREGLLSLLEEFSFVEDKELYLRGLFERVGDNFESLSLEGLGSVLSVLRIELSVRGFRPEEIAKRMGELHRTFEGGSGRG